jgi:hypothetical protein
MRFSVCIPTCEMDGRGAAFLSRSLAALDRQTLRDFEVTVSDHSGGAVLENLRRRRRQFYPLRYVRCGIERGNSSANSDFAMRQACGHVVKIIHQDDFLFADDALERMDAGLLAAPDRIWGGVGCIHVNESETHLYGPHHPRMDPMMLGGSNRFGAPSVMFVRRENVLPFDEALIWVGDCELYHRLHQTWGEPILIDELLVAVPQWGRQVTRTLDDGPRKTDEVHYALRKHGAAPSVVG